MSEWKEYKLGEIADVTKLAGYEYTKHIKYDNTGEIIALRALNVREGVLDLSDVKRIPKETSLALPRSQLKKNDILFTYVGANIGQFALVPEDEKFHLAPNICRIRCAEVCEPYYLYSYFRTIQFKEALDGFTHGSSQPTIPMGTIREITVALPDKKTQKEIASILSSLDDKIDLLQRQNKTLEAMAEALFREWFVENSENGDELVKVGDVVTVKGGTTPSTSRSEYWDGDIFWTSPRDLSSTNSLFLFDTERKITEEGLKQIGSGLLPAGTLLLSSRAPIGYLAITDIPVAVNQGYIAMSCDRGISNHFMYLWCKQNMEIIEGAGNGSVFQEISKSSFKGLDFKIPDKSLLSRFDEIVSLLFERIRINCLQQRSLKKTRDGLLPRLMSGDVTLQ